MILYDAEKKELVFRHAGNHRKGTGELTALEQLSLYPHNKVGRRAYYHR